MRPTIARSAAAVGFAALALAGIHGIANAEGGTSQDGSAQSGSTAEPSAGPCVLTIPVEKLTGGGQDIGICAAP
ncbi:hypothetical protein SAMN05421805_1011518 [Saccharopolyspora antimicrobica]|uniref:Small secreted domain n=1 Tax=Saccharopolyspora antimicrobica TaxID=455193 RepID=A0A1I4TPK9_9PSEU|nr:hypothetical protein [Saccharopolyspora antimicrobica]RKT88497.1 hypothetical protein ATL45_6932 [Saccharopolyspora antimicrobica]SFM78629.1 hypothetical protein SAMN05421805_1011518 [Saccharopolyspora antimicrobica]